jgi:hypothetical protein
MAMIASIINSNEPELVAAAEAARLGSTKSHLHNKNRKKWLVAQAKYFQVSLPFMVRFVELMNMSSQDRPQCVTHLTYAFRGTKQGLCEITRNEVLHSIIERWLKKGYICKVTKKTDKGHFKGFNTTDKGWWPTKEVIFNNHTFSTKLSNRVSVTGDYYVRMVNKSLDKCIETKHLEEMPLLKYSVERTNIMNQCEDEQYRIDRNISLYKAGVYSKVQKAAQNKVEFIARSSDDDRGRAYKLFSEEDIIADKSLRYAVKSATTDPINGDTVEPI